ncbi:unknown protein [Seminavis robusta]|uniref:Uncharacterized protein n=1 Tax=Seminavis robusta TaxID=568900 RepID=A0A9N8E5M0_9STRA|nr:unknown protein [Seminavis robusta]|eukprot:Sro523_g159800.1 n/a (524) ;mRNA; r:42080-43651
MAIVLIVTMTGASNMSSSSTSTDNDDEDFRRNTTTLTESQTSNGRPMIPRAEKPAEPVLPSPSKKTVRQLYTEDENNHKGWLLMMCLGLKSEDGSRDLGDVEQEPWSLLKKKQIGNFKVKKPKMLAEVNRRCAISGKKEQPNNWNVTRLKKWLTDHPIETEEDVKFLQRTENSLHDATKNVTTQQGGEGEKKSKQQPFEHRDFLRLFAAACTDRVRKSLKLAGKVMDRQRLDARNRTDAPDNFYEELHATYHDDMFLAEIPSIPNLHEDFLVEDLILASEVTPCSVEYIKSKWTFCKSKLSTLVARYEKSGAGEGQIHHDVEELAQADADEEDVESNEAEASTDQPEKMPSQKAWGSDLLGHYLQAGEEKATYVHESKGEKPYLLYLWHLADQYQILDHVVSQISDNVAATGDAVKTDTSKVQRKRKSDDEEEVSNVRQAVIAGNVALIEIGYQQCFENLRSMKKELKENSMALMKEQAVTGPERNEVAIIFWRAQVEDNEREIRRLNKRLADLDKTKPQPKQ